MIGHQTIECFFCSSLFLFFWKKFVIDSFSFFFSSFVVFFCLFLFIYFFMLHLWKQSSSLTTTNWINEWKQKKTKISHKSRKKNRIKITTKKKKKKNSFVDKLTNEMNEKFFRFIVTKMNQRRKIFINLIKRNLSKCKAPCNVSCLFDQKPTIFRMFVWMLPICLYRSFEARKKK